MDLFFYGTMRFPALLELVLGDSAPDLRFSDAILPDHSVHWAKDQAFPMIVPHAGAEAEGVLVQGLTKDALARLDFYEGGFAYSLREVALRDGHKAMVYFPEEGRWPLGDAWSLQAWRAHWGDMTLGAARELMGHFGNLSTEAAQSLLPFFRARAWAREIAKDGAPATLRRGSEPGAVDVTPRLEESLGGFFGLAAFDIRAKRFDGDWSTPVQRACFYRL